MKRLLGLFFGAVIGVFALGGEQASAATVDLGTLSGAHTAFSMTYTGTGTQDYSFHLDTATPVLAFASTVSSALFLDIAIPSVADKLTVGSTITFDTRDWNAVLGAGDYVMTLFARSSGGAPVTVNGYMTTVSVAATPIPPAGLMMLTALGGLGFLVARRKRGDAATGTVAV